MGWGSGSTLMDSVIDAVEATTLSTRERKTLYKKLIDAFEGADWDTQDECSGRDPAFDSALRDLHPEWEDAE